MAIDSALLVENLTKTFRVSSRNRANYKTLRETLSQRIGGLVHSAALITKGQRPPDLRPIDFRALDDISFSVGRGEVLGLIGHNGAGKSTLLKVLARITAPSSGQVTIHGRVGSLLEIGTGFHSELTGRENVFLSGAILGMKRAEVQRAFDEIINFAEVDDFLDMPVKFYSSGMYMRLAFAVAAHLETEILLIDEVLAVGDARFQKKCLGKMANVSRSGRTIIFVSHNVGAIQNLCDRCIVLKRGRIVSDDRPEIAVASYLEGGHADELGGTTIERGAWALQATRLWIETPEGAKVSQVEFGNDAILRFDIDVSRNVRGAVFAILFVHEGTPAVYSYETDLSGTHGRDFEMGQYRAAVRLPTSLFKEGLHTVQVKVGVGFDDYTDPRASCSFHITNTTQDLTHRAYRRDRPGILQMNLAWDVTRHPG